MGAELVHCAGAAALKKAKKDRARVRPSCVRICDTLAESVLVCCVCSTSPKTYHIHHPHGNGMVNDATQTSDDDVVSVEESHIDQHE